MKSCWHLLAAGVWSDPSTSIPTTPFPKPLLQDLWTPEVWRKKGYRGLLSLLTTVQFSDHWCFLSTYLLSAWVHEHCPQRDFDPISGRYLQSVVQKYAAWGIRHSRSPWVSDASPTISKQVCHQHISSPWFSLPFKFMSLDGLKFNLLVWHSSFHTFPSLDYI